MKHIGLIIILFFSALSGQSQVKDGRFMLPDVQAYQRGIEIFKPGKKLEVFSTVDSLKAEVNWLKSNLIQRGIEVVTLPKGTLRIQKIRLSHSADAFFKQHPEGYRININQDNIQITAGTKAGIYYGALTLSQLFDSGKIRVGVIQDYPAFSWRAYMVDVGRNYQSVALLKQQIDVMAAHKLNVFHLHLTEDIAWRLAIKKYPQLTSAAFMQRNKGMFYSEAALKELIQYCKARYITLVPEIDMPGHSAAFKRAMGVDMQSDSGMVILKNIIKEFITTYQLPYLHIGADEVKITNKNFVPEMSTYIESFGVKVIGWEPGGNFNASTIRQLWMDDAGLTSGKGKIQYIDSRHLYLNHMDPLEAVVTIFNRQLADVDEGNAEALGATLCLWPDRAIAKENDAIEMNGVYPAMLAFAERCWLGKGYKGWVANMDGNGIAAFNAFQDFEKRLMAHRERYFSGLSFPYQKQSDMVWKLYGPFPNGGNLTKSFEPEQDTFNPDKRDAAQNALGGTVILRHWWAPKISAILKSPAENTTWYAFRKIWSEQDVVKPFWIGFNNLSRSQATDTPQKDTWDNRGSQIWVNNEIVSAPSWKNAGHKGDLEIPLVDEGYEYRKPTMIRLKKGWNIIRIKAPIAGFKGKDWNNPVKWMFTCVEMNTSDRSPQPGR
jgi:hypothetical protein